MNAMPPSFPGNCLQDAVNQGQETLTLRWQTLVEAGDLVAALAGVDHHCTDAVEPDFPALAREADAWRRERAEYGLADLAAIMEAGIAALLSIKDRGADARPAALILWSEFLAAEKALFGLVRLRTASLPPATREDA